MILATAIGEESFDDVNGTGFYQAGDPFSDLGEPYLDANESGAYVLGDYFLDFYNTGKYEGPSGAFKGITCSGGSCTSNTLAIGVSHLLIMSTSGANINGLTASGTLNGATEKTGIQVTFNVQDLNGNPMAAGTTVTTTADSAIGTLTGPGTNFTIGCRSGGGPGSNNPGYDTLGVTLTTASAPGSGNITITVTSPESKTATIVTLPVTVN